MNTKPMYVFSQMDNNINLYQGLLRYWGIQKPFEQILSKYPSLP